MAQIAFRELNPVNFLERAAVVYAGRTALVDDDGFTCTYAEFWARAKRMAGLLAGLGVRPGGRVAVLSPNTRLLLDAHYGVPLARGVLVALNTRLAPAEIAYILGHAQVGVVLVDREYAEVLAEALTQVAHPVQVLTDADYEDQAATAPELVLECPDERGMVSINYTSGTTGQPKGVMYHYRGAYLQAVAMAHHMKLDMSSKYLWTLPMFHCNGWTFPWAVTAAGAVHYGLRKVSGANMWNKIAAGVTHFCGAPTVLTMLANHTDIPEIDHPINVVTGGAPPWPALLQRLGELGISMQHVYGLTETYGPATICEVPPEWADLPLVERSMLMARQGVTNVVGEPVRVLDGDFRDVPADGHTQGEICLRGNNVMLGYYLDEEATARATTPDGYFRSGDIGVMHPDGYVQLQDRLKDLIISGGENISSVQVEAAITELPGVIEAAVIGKPDDKWGEVPIAYVVTRDGVELTEQEVIEHVRSRLAKFKAPREVHFGQLPKTSTGKVRKNVLRQGR
ncbi:AMP-binding protein [Granulicoccus phenolivorans]|uniref:AMP-binding protein n=1 Tax=Granulicoccus phenolivorans TaxID=266854 RepID=UPI00041921C6|nr:AMP-binding protein [Granulicoccus phenolivorans]